MKRQEHAAKVAESHAGTVPCKVRDVAVEVLAVEWNHAQTVGDHFVWKDGRVLFDFHHVNC